MDGCLPSSRAGGDWREHRGQQREGDNVETNLVARIIKLGLLRRLGFGGCFALAGERLLRVPGGRKVSLVLCRGHGLGHLWLRSFLGLRVRVGRAMIKVLLAIAVLVSFLVPHRRLPPRLDPMCGVPSQTFRLPVVNLGAVWETLS